MIRGFRSKADERFYCELRPSRGLRSIAKPALRKLQQLDSATCLQDLRLPGNRLEKLRGDREGQHSVRINDQWRICFCWQNGDAYEVEIVDYH